MTSCNWWMCDSGSCGNTLPPLTTHHIANCDIKFIYPSIAIYSINCIFRYNCIAFTNYMGSTYRYNSIYIIAIILFIDIIVYLQSYGVYFMIIVFYHQAKTPISFWYKSNLQILFWQQDTLPTRLMNLVPCKFKNVYII